MKNKKVLSIFITIAILFTALIPTGAYASTNVPVITVVSAKGSAGSTVEVALKIDKNPGILGAVLSISYDSNLTLLSAESGSAFSALKFTEPSVLGSGCSFVWEASSLLADDIKDGDILKLLFRVSSSAQAGDKYSINASYVDGNIRDKGVNPLNVEIVNGAISVGGYKSGDLNSDDTIDVADLIYFRRHLDGGYEQEIDEAAMDINGDKNIDEADLTLLRKHLMGEYNIGSNAYNGKNYAYILEAGQSSSAFADTWQVKLLTARDGVVTYDVDEEIITATAGNDLAAKNLLAALDGTDDGRFNIAWVVPTNKTAAEARFVEFDTNSKGEISEIIYPDGTLNAIDGEYRAENKILDGKPLEENTVVFYFAKAKADDVYKTDINYFTDEGAYEGYVFKNDDSENCVVLVTKGVGALKAEDGFAIATKVTNGETDGQPFTKISYVKGEEEGIVTFNKESENTVAGGLAYGKIDMGDIFLFNANAEGVVTEYAVLAEYNGGDFAIIAKAAEAIAANAFGKDIALGIGYLYSSRRTGSLTTLYVAMSKAASTPSDIRVLLVPSETFKYTYNSELKNDKIETGDYLAVSSVDFWTNKDEKSQGTATPVIFLEYDELAVDVYTASSLVGVSFVDNLID